MGDSGPTGPTGGNPFENFGGFLADLGRMLQSQGPLNWDVARQFAHQLATGGAAEANPDPIERIRLEELARVAELRVADATGLATSTGGRATSVVSVSAAEWARRALEAYRPLFERLSRSLSAGWAAEGAAEGEPGAPDGEPGGDPMGAMFGGLIAMMGPAMLGVQAGSMVGHLASRAFGQYDLPLPRPPSHELAVVGSHLTSFAEEWSLPADDLRLSVCLSELTTHAVLGIPHVHQRLQDLVESYLGAFRPDPTALEDKLGGLDLNDLSALPEAFNDPEVILGAITSPEQRELQPRLLALLAVVGGYVDHVVDGIGSGLIESHGMVTEALHRRRVEATEADHLVAHLFGLELGREQYERGEAFIAGVIERAGAEALPRLWVEERMLPTPAEVDAPGLWLARIELPQD